MSDKDYEFERITPETTPKQLRDFVEERVRDPIRVGPDERVTVFNLSSHDVMEDKLEKKARKLHRELYVIPYQVPGAWGYMQEILPREIREAELLVYSQRDERYKAFPNFLRLSMAQSDEATREELAGYIGEIAL